MTNALIQLLIFIAIGFAWRYFKPGDVTADSLQRAIMSLIHWIFLPIFVFFALAVIKFNASLLKYSLYVIIATAIALAASWFWLQRTQFQGKTRGALLLASCFGSVLFIGLPLTEVMIGSWTSRLAVIYLLLANVLIMYTVGLFLARALNTPSKLKKPVTAFTDEAKTIIREPVVIAALLGLFINLIDVKLPGWIGGLSNLAGGALVPLLILTVGLSLNWDKKWQSQITGILPVAAIKLILVPLVLLIMVKVFGSPGAKTSQALLINGMMPASLVGLAICDRFKFDKETYAMVFVVTSALALIAVPLWMQLT